MRRSALIPECKSGICESVVHRESNGNETVPFLVGKDVSLDLLLRKVHRVKLLSLTLKMNYGPYFQEKN